MREARRSSRKRAERRKKNKENESRAIRDKANAQGHLWSSSHGARTSLDSEKYCRLYFTTQWLPLSNFGLKLKNLFMIIISHCKAVSRETQQALITFLHFIL